MAVGLAQAMAKRAPVAVFAAVGRDSDALFAQLLLVPEVELVTSPRQASILLVVGNIPRTFVEQLETVHDQLPHPRGTVWWHATPLFSFRDQALEAVATTAQQAALGQLLREIQARLLSGTRESEPDLKSDVPPAPWPGKGDHGQGGEGMMGGMPYGRPMAMMGPDLRDGLQLDEWSFSVGPFYHALPPGLVAHVTLQGDVIQQWKIHSKPYPRSLRSVFMEALVAPVAIAELEAARAHDHLLLLARMLQLEELESLGYRALALAAQLISPSTYEEAIKSGAVLFRLLRVNGFLFLGGGIGRISARQAMDFGGFVARALGASEDFRNGNDAYRKLGFAPVCQQAGDLQARRIQLVAEIEQSLMLMRKARQSGSLFTADRIETLYGPLTADQMPLDKSDLLESLLAGHEWGDAVAVIGSLPIVAVVEQKESAA